jgi:hypothetical protein
MQRAEAAPQATGSEGDAAEIPRWRLLIFRILAGLSGLFFLSILPQAISPWHGPTLSNMTGVHDPDLHRWSAALAGGPDMGMGLVLLYLAFRPLGAPILLQWVALAVIVFLAANVPFVGPYLIVIAVPVVLTLVAYPRPRDLLQAPWAEGIRLPVFVIGALISVVLFADGARALAAQIQGQGELAVNYDWASNGEHLINVGLAALLAGMRRPGASVLALMAAAVVAFMGAAAITVPANPGSWGTAGGVGATVAAIALCAAVAYEWRRGGRLRAGEAVL